MWTRHGCIVRTQVTNENSCAEAFVSWNAKLLTAWSFKIEGGEYKAARWSFGEINELWVVSVCHKQRITAGDHFWIPQSLKQLHKRQVVLKMFFLFKIQTFENFYFLELMCWLKCMRLFFCLDKSRLLFVECSISLSLSA